MAATLADGQARFEKEARFMDELKAGRTSLDLMGLSQWRSE
jgi:4-hydroxy-4-methyl-2-oxoglutarate aldolase